VYALYLRPLRGFFMSIILSGSIGTRICGTSQPFLCFVHKEMMSQPLSHFNRRVWGRKAATRGRVLLRIWEWATTPNTLISEAEG
jgi:hypothetical protein